MVITGVVVMGFLIWHVLQFRFGPYYETIYLSVNGGEPVRDLYRLITEEFSNIWVVLGYTVALSLLSLHL